MSLHYPLYCTIKVGYCDSGLGASGPLPPGVLNVTAEQLRASLEPLFLRFGVDVVLTGHNHNYERTHPVADLKVKSTGRVVDGVTVYDRPGAPIHYVIGTGGADPDAVSMWRNMTTDWVAFRAFEDAREASNWGWSRVFANASILAIDFVDAERNAVLDSVHVMR